MIIRVKWCSYRLFPYERMLGRKELENFLGARVMFDDGSEVSIEVPETEVLGRITRLTYFEHATLPDGSRITTEQYRLEEGYRVLKGGTKHAHQRQQTRYSAHGLHEYRGKFNPQIVRSVFNLLQADATSRVLDPFCGSGTVLVEAHHLGADAIGLDLNPLAVEIANAKLAALRLGAEDLRIWSTRLANEAMERSPSDDFRLGWPDVIARPIVDRYFRSPTTREYLERWFSTSVLAQIAILLEIADAQVPALRSVCRVILSDTLREVSYQEPSDLRIRRRSDAEPNYPVIAMFTSRLVERIGAVCAVEDEAGRRASEGQRAILADVRDLDGAAPATVLRDYRPNVVVTSPPYASALPYIDTQRLSLVALGLLDANCLSSHERKLIGGREVTSARRRELEGGLRVNRAELPESSVSCVQSLFALTDHPENGFRKRNVPALVYQYLTDMQLALRGLAETADEECIVAMVIGPNRTRLGGEETIIDTPSLLADIAVSTGWVPTDTVPLDAFHRFDLHSANSIREEVLLILRRDSF